MKDYDGKKLYEVDRILDKRIDKNTIFYLVKWLGYDCSQATWEPESSLL